MLGCDLLTVHKCACVCLYSATAIVKLNVLSETSRHGTHPGGCGCFGLESDNVSVTLRKPSVFH